MISGSPHSPGLPPDPRKRFYTGLGAQRTPPDVCALLVLTARHLAAAGMILRSGAEKGAEQAFAAGAAGQAEIFAPRAAVLTLRQPLAAPDRRAWAEAAAIASRLHPNWHSLDRFTRRTHARAVFTLLGADLALPSAYVICWAPLTPDGLPEGPAARTVLALARELHISVYNLADAAVRDRFRRRLDELAYPG